ncbi:hypothetical protein [Nitratireductor sp. CH_MIT9313-5]|uniref:hypothetical protein n=1 Tax=Nitratireductor sp. CH_MIT9313-5 TaxID=3107764 RepID=UPI00300A09CE
MADFTAVLRKTIGGLKENTPEMREKVYQKARATIDAKLAAVTPPPPAAVVERQKALLEDAIASVEAEFSAPPAPPEPQPDHLDDVLAELNRPGTTVEPVTPAVPEEEARSPSEPEHHSSRDEIQPVSPDPVTADMSERSDTPAFPEDDREPVSVIPVEARHMEEPGDVPDRPAPDSGAAVAESDGYAPKGDEPRDGAYETYEDEPRRRKGIGGVGLILIFLALLGAVGFGLWQFRDDVSQLAGFDNFDALVARIDPAQPADGGGSQPAEEAETTEEAEQVAAPAEPEEAAGEETVEEPEANKFTQRLLPNGEEVDEGSAGGEPGLGEGTSVAQATPGSAEGGETAEGATSGEAAGAQSQQALPVGQRAIFYEESTTSAQGSASSGNVVWSVVQESPGADQPPEPAIRADATIPEKQIQLKMTIRRNADDSLPASHIVELIFLTPDGFGGGGVESVQRIAMKRSEQDTGNPLLGIPAKIADGFFLVALSDSQADEEMNLTVMRRQDWIDIPIAYKSGRRALFTMEKGAPGARVFNEVIAGWERAAEGG